MMNRHFNPVTDGYGTWWHDEKGRVHRDDGEPVFIRLDGSNFWYKNGQFHRENGPAIEWSDGTKSWYLNDVRYSFQDWIDKLDISIEEKVLLLLKYK